MTDQRFSEVVAGGNSLASLVALRDLLAREIESCESKRDMAALSQRLLDVLARIDGSGGELKTSEDDTFDELARRRASRGSSPEPDVRAGRRDPG